jgi:hypothetical protein
MDLLGGERLADAAHGKPVVVPGSEEDAAREETVAEDVLLVAPSLLVEPVHDPEEHGGSRVETVGLAGIDGDGELLIVRLESAELRGDHDAGNPVADDDRPQRFFHRRYLSEVNLIERDRY